MATIFERNNRDGSTTYRMIVRRKGIPTLCLAFSTYKEAAEWVKNNEEKYILDPTPYLEWIRSERLDLQRGREFKRKFKS